jgi:hypothetical protein
MGLRKEFQHVVVDGGSKLRESLRKQGHSERRCGGPRRFRQDHAHRRVAVHRGSHQSLLRVDEGNTITDFDEEEIQRKITISTAIAVAEWKKTKINILDTPGYNIFINDTRAALVAADAALVLVDGVAGVEVQTEKVWQFAERFQAPARHRHQ